MRPYHQLIISKSPIYFITFVTWERLELNLAARQIVLDSCLFFNEKRYQIYSAVIMPDHVHLLIQPFMKNNQVNNDNNSASILLAFSHENIAPEKQNQSQYWTIGSILHSVKSYSAKQIPQVMNHIGKVWQDGRYDRRIRNNIEFNNVWEYIKQNPVKANLINNAEDYSFLWEMF